jgi:hypothetical protein
MKAVHTGDVDKAEAVDGKEELEVLHYPPTPPSMKELAEAAQAAARQGEVAFKEFWRPLTVAQRSMLGGMGEELRKIMDGPHDPMTGEVSPEG